MIKVYLQLAHNMLGRVLVNYLLSVSRFEINSGKFLKISEAYLDPVIPMTKRFSKNSYLLLGGRYMLTSWNSARVAILSLAEFFLCYMNTSPRVENKNISTRAEIKNTICSMFIRHDRYCKWKPLINKLWDSKNEETEKHGKNSSCSQFCTNNLFTAIQYMLKVNNRNCRTKCSKLTIC